MVEEIAGYWRQDESMNQQRLAPGDKFWINKSGMRGNSLETRQNVWVRVVWIAQRGRDETYSSNKPIFLSVLYKKRATPIPIQNRCISRPPGQGRTGHHLKIPRFTQLHVILAPLTANRSFFVGFISGPVNLTISNLSNIQELRTLGAISCDYQGQQAIQDKTRA